MRKYRAWRSTVHSIIKGFTHPTSWMFSLSEKYSRIIWNSRVVNCQADKYLNAKVHSFISKDVSEYIRENMGSISIKI